MLKRIAHAKINLALHVTGQRDDGYHLLDSLVVFAEFGDVVSVIAAKDSPNLVSLKIDGPFSKNLEAGANNLVNRAAFALGYQIAQDQEKLCPVEIKLTKNLPLASGIGGGSADAAAVLLALQEFWGSDIDLEKIALELGADVPMCLHSKPLRAEGVGDEVTLLESKDPINIVLLNPSLEVSTPEIFTKLVRKNNSVISNEPVARMPDVLALNAMRNDLQSPAIELQSRIQGCLDALSRTKAQLHRMSGSGATCFGIYATAKLAQEAANNIKSQHPDWWCVATKTTVS